MSSDQQEVQEVTNSNTDTNTATLPKLDIGSQANESNQKQGYRPFWDVCIASVRQFDNDPKKRFGFAAPVMWPDELPEKFDFAKSIPDLKFSNLDGDCFIHLDRGGYVTDSGTGSKMPFIMRPHPDNPVEYQNPIEPPTLRELVVVGRTVNDRGNFAIWWCYLEDYLNAFKSLAGRPVFRLQEQSSAVNTSTDQDGKATAPTSKSRTLWMGQAIKELAEHWPARQYPANKYEKFRRFFSVQDLDDQSVFQEIDFDPRLVDPAELDDKVAEVLAGKLEHKQQQEQQPEHHSEIQEQEQQEVVQA